MNKVLIYGSNGQLGWELTRKFTKAGIQAIGLDLPSHDVSDQVQVGSVISNEKPEIVINASAFTAVDQAETQMETAFKVNKDGPGYLAKACQSENIPLIHVSTDYVFDGYAHRPYREDDPVNPIGVYGQSKEQGECEVRKWLPQHIILRTSWVYGVHGNNFVKTMVRLGKENALIKVVKDQYGCPTSAGDLGEAIVSIVEQIRNKGSVQWGTYHYCGSGITTWYGFADMIFELAEQYLTLKLTELRPIPTTEYPTPARRPSYSALDCGKIKRNFGIIAPTWQSSLEKMMEELFRDD